MVRKSASAAAAAIAASAADSSDSEADMPLSQLAVKKPSNGKAKAKKEQKASSSTAASKGKENSSSSKTAKPKAKRERKVYDMPGQRRDTPDELDVVRLFYESLLRQKPESPMVLRLFCHDDTVIFVYVPTVIVKQNVSPGAEMVPGTRIAAARGGGAYRQRAGVAAFEEPLEVEAIDSRDQEEEECHGGRQEAGGHEAQARVGVQGYECGEEGQIEWSSRVEEGRGRVRRG
eukprot:TRINITY_DN68070_c0_g1_i1.p2 TRINITY_DN68070_c0_g1~~TRINITY_DN68070_c0_g1_i1.p2  ORF type:complete len:232 (-),score=76.83 TRINITY_DN68070_c0_g1_i1:149-844(-)